MPIAELLISWYEKNKRDLPWRSTRDPYAIWLSEVILQQTRVNQGMAYYFRFLELFPTVFDLANASEEVVLKAWQGLGYYSRARNLHATAKIVAGPMAGHFPSTSQGLRTLKGVGDYTAAAIASFCFDECIPVLDGNVQRVAARLVALEEAVDKPKGKAHLMQLLKEWIPESQPATFNQAMMELGALVCTPQKPSCTECPLQSQCSAFALGRQNDFPIKSAKTKVTDLWMYYIVALSGEQILVRHRQHSGIWKGLFDFPSVDTAGPLSLDDVFQHWKKERNLKDAPVMIAPPVELTHILSHRRVHAVFLKCSIDYPIEPSEGEKWIGLDRFSSLGVSRLVDRYMTEHSQVLD